MNCKTDFAGNETVNSGLFIVSRTFFSPCVMRISNLGDTLIHALDFDRQNYG